MKKLLIIMLLAIVTLGASAQYRHGYYRPHVVIVGGYSPYYSYDPFGYPYPYYSYGYRYAYRPTKLDLKVEDIKNDYQERIWAARHDKSLAHKERRQEVRRLKHDRDEAIADARRNYYRR